MKREESMIECPFCHRKFYISEVKRRKIIEALKSGPLTWSELLATLKFSKPTLSKHLKVLLREGVIERRLLNPNSLVAPKIVYVLKKEI